MDLPLDVVGCSAVRRSKAGPVCELPDNRTVKVVFPPGTRGARVSLDEPGAAVVDGGLTEREADGPVLAVSVPNGAAVLVVDATVAGKAARGRIRVAAAEKRDWFEEARAARGKGELDRAQTIAAAHLKDAAPVDRGLARGLLARIALSRGRADEAFPMFREAIELHRSADRISDAVDDSFALAFALHQRSQRYTEARAALDGIDRELSLYAEGRARAPYYRGSLAAETGDRRQALTLLREAERAAHRLGMTKLERNARAALALQLQEIGRARASLPLLADLEKEIDDAVRSGKGEQPSACERVEIANNRGWGALLVNEAATEDGAAATEDARGPLERALSINGCADAYVRGFALSNLARLALASGDLGSAERRLAEARAGVKEPRGTVRLDWLDLEGRLLMARGRERDALRTIDEGLALARASLLRAQEWSLLVSRAEVLVGSKRKAEAIDALRMAEDVLDDALLLVPLGEGRGAFAGGRSRSGRALVGILVEQGKALEAAAVAEHARARVLASALGAVRLEQLAPPARARWEEAVRSFRAARTALDTEAANDWKLPADALARAVSARTERERELKRALEGAMTLLGGPKQAGVVEAGAPGDIAIDIYRDLDGFIAIARRDGRVTTYRLPQPNGRIEDLSHALLEPIAQDIEQATSEHRVVVRAYGAWRAVDVHALPWRGEPLIARVPVVYSISLGARPPASSGHTLVVGDPTSDLPASLEEANATARAFGMRDAGVRLLVRDRATSRAVNDDLRGATWLHYAGHGVFAGEEGWESALPLASGGRLSAPDILSLAPAPRTVVLTGCDAAKSVGEAEGLGLAQAFIVAGSLEVLAPVRRVPDTLASKLSAALYESPALTPLHGPARAAALRVRREDASSDWAAFRILVP